MRFEGVERKTEYRYDTRMEREDEDEDEDEDERGATKK
jgi:hypothetical protein